MPASTYLAHFGISLAQAHDFVVGNIGSPNIIYSVAKQYGVTSEMLGEIAAGPGAPAYTTAQVHGYFAAQGMMVTDLDPGRLLPSDLLPVAGSVLAYDTSPGALSVDALRAQVVAQTGELAYARAFDPGGYAGSADGTFSAGETGLPVDVPATSQALESLFYGSIIQFASRLDAAEAASLQVFLRNHAGGHDEDPVVQAQLTALLNGAVSTPADVPYLGESQIAQAAAHSGVAMVGAMQGFHEALFDELLSGFEPFLR